MDINRKTAYLALMDVESRKAYSNLAINHQIALNKPGSPAFVRELVYGVLENKTKGERQLVALPEQTVCLGSKIEEAIELAQLKSGDYSFIWSPPGASNLPVQLIWEKTE